MSSKKFILEYNKVTEQESAEVIFKETSITISGKGDRFSVWKTSHETGMVRQNPSATHFYSREEAIKKAYCVLTKLLN